MKSNFWCRPTCTLAVSESQNFVETVKEINAQNLISETLNIENLTTFTERTGRPVHLPEYPSQSTPMSQKAYYTYTCKPYYGDLLTLHALFGIYMYTQIKSSSKSLSISRPLIDICGCAWRPSYRLCRLWMAVGSELQDAIIKRTNQQRDNGDGSDIWPPTI